MLYHVRGRPGARRGGGGAGADLSGGGAADVAASFQAAVVDVLRIKLRRAAKVTGAKTLVLGGGVSANTALRQAAEELAAKLACTLRMPPLRYCLDNAAMVAGLGWHYLRQGRTAGLDLPARATLRG